MKNKKKLIKIAPWYQGDHMTFVMNELPAIALSSENIDEIASEIAHREKDFFQDILFALL